jgi:hypothetical protein
MSLLALRIKCEWYVFFLYLCCRLFEDSVWFFTNNVFNRFYFYKCVNTRREENHVARRVLNMNVEG